MIAINPDEIQDKSGVAGRGAAPKCFSCTQEKILGADDLTGPFHLDFIRIYSVR